MKKEAAGGEAEPRLLEGTPTLDAVASEDRADPIAERADRRIDGDLAILMHEPEVDAGRGQAQADDQLDHLAELGRDGLQELPAGRHRSEEVADGDGGALGSAGLAHVDDRPALDTDARRGPASRARVVSSTVATAAMLGSASPRKPSVPMRSRSASSRILLVAWRVNASVASSDDMP